MSKSLAIFGIVTDFVLFGFIGFILFNIFSPGIAVAAGITSAVAGTFFDLYYHREKIKTAIGIN